jgi:histidinol dehydrogenase
LSDRETLYVTAPRSWWLFDCAIDFLAGPTEVVIVSRLRGRPDFIAADLVAQAEHDPEALAVLVTTSRSWRNRFIPGSKNSPAAISNGAAIPRRHGDSGGRIAPGGARVGKPLAPEHITVDAGEIPQVHNAGSVFVGDYSAQAAGDYASGPNHVLPTAGVARYRGGLSVADFLKVITVQELSAAGLRKIAPAVESLAETEGLPAHAHRSA